MAAERAAIRRRQGLELRADLAGGEQPASLDELIGEAAGGAGERRSGELDQRLQPPAGCGSAAR